MEILFQITGIALITVFLCIVVRANSAALSGLLALSACVMIALVCIELIDPIVSVLQTLRELSGLSGTVTAPLLKTVGIGLLTQISAAVCDDSGESSIARAVEIGGSLLSLYVSLPLLSSLLNLLQETLGG